VVLQRRLAGGLGDARVGHTDTLGGLDGTDVVFAQARQDKQGRLVRDEFLQERLTKDIGTTLTLEFGVNDEFAFPDKELVRVPVIDDPLRQIVTTVSPQLLERKNVVPVRTDDIVTVEHDHPCESRLLEQGIKTCHDFAESEIFEPRETSKSCLIDASNRFLAFRYQGLNEHG